MGIPGAQAMQAEDEIPYYLFRFFDFTVESGKRYVYRVRLMLLNPNYEIPPRFLISDELDKKPYLCYNDRMSGNRCRGVSGA